MKPVERDERLQRELAALNKLSESSSIFRFSTPDHHVDWIEVKFLGKGLRRNQYDLEKVELLEGHEIELRLPHNYLERGPDIRWITPIAHPNVSFSGFVSLEEIGLPWNQELTLDIVCERLWDVCRYHYVSLENAINEPAKNWVESPEREIQFPVDSRPLRDVEATQGENIICYIRKNSANNNPRMTRPEQLQKEPGVVVIGEEAPNVSQPSPGISVPTPPIVNPISSGVKFIGADSGPPLDLVPVEIIPEKSVPPIARRSGVDEIVFLDDAPRTKGS